ncbi:predicted protein [Aspergillus nidulans FGSC A4]|uniref:Uncharacterized protein n=1 Tax=Emericella nidulans (strain FGSC A4 / ATCC 38163 / CBS 112.46 / NRRL 194 / M139) TaxID=227321 RepID=Q5B415_EMENI|nr:hypothetical protein [Aspergillus nidulans FGSC A4]EAA60757.1 predicted protein [Aspergillus nidulans FGSC A4]CBF76938.1 TPA: conserved hypothetical protein [Aspergillus nidulans FGSC A4]|eukprot:XP_662319.1 predicted protein [Aspergillus nidulans FGSC A4]
MKKEAYHHTALFIKPRGARKMWKLLPFRSSTTCNDIVGHVGLGMIFMPRRGSSIPSLSTCRQLLMTPCFGQNRQIDIILRALFAAEWKMKFAQAWVIEFEQRSKGSATGSVGLDRIAAAIRVVYCPYP